MYKYNLLLNFSGLSLASGLVVFASVVSDVSLERPRRPTGTAPVFQYRYGWSFFSAGAAFVLSELAALLCITAYLRRFPSVEAMVRAVVPGAERKLLRRAGSGGTRESTEEEERGPPLEKESGGDPGGRPLLARTPDLCTREPQCQSCKKERERELAGTTVPIALGGSQTLRPQHHRQQDLTGGRRYATLGHYPTGGLLHCGVLGVSEPASSWSSASSSSLSLGVPHHQHHQPSRHHHLKPNCIPPTMHPPAPPPSVI
ncbi:hypothetical protein AAG570_005540 [Ranatra chinensis]|uniref:Uncharacterized protein n=1 Tax=Ranatra chinensis TaxID=642074 RepID=A0ABD0YLB5_9HEMI